MEKAGSESACVSFARKSRPAMRLVRSGSRTMAWVMAAMWSSLKLEVANAGAAMSGGAEGYFLGGDIWVRAGDCRRR